MPTFRFELVVASHPEVLTDLLVLKYTFWTGLQTGAVPVILKILILSHDGTRNYPPLSSCPGRE